MRNYRLLFTLGLLTLMMGFVPGGSTGAASPDPLASVQVDRQVWADLAAAPDHRVRFILSMVETPGEGAESAIPAQMALEQPLAILQSVGTVTSAKVYYGANAIVVEGGPGAVRFLADWPEAAAIGPYRPGSAWETVSPASVQAASGHITGKVTGPNGTTPLPNIRVYTYFWTGGSDWELVSIGNTGTDGSYDIGGLTTGYYRIKFVDPAGSYATEFYNNQPDFSVATNIPVTDGQTTANIDASLAGAGRIAGTVRAATNNKGLADIIVSACKISSSSCPILGSAVTGADGTYTIGGLPPGSYRVRFADSYMVPRYVPQYYNGQVNPANATPVNVTAGQTKTSIDASMGDYGKMTGKVTAIDGTTALGNITVDVYQYDATENAWDWVSSDTTDNAGLYEVAGLGSSDYRVGFSDPLNQYFSEFYNNKASIETADNVHVNLGATTANINASLEAKFAPSVPTEVSASDGIYTDKVRVTWTAASVATYYQVFRNSSNSTSGATLLGSPNVSAYDDTSPNAGSNYWYFVKACNSAGCSGSSSGDAGYRAITAPIDVSASDGTYTDKVQVTWTAVSGATYYMVYRNSTNSSGGVTLLGSPSATTYSDTSGTAGSTYWYFVRGCSSSGCSAFSSSDSGYRMITVTTGVNASDGTFTDKVRVTWTAVSGATYYQVYRNSINSNVGAILLVSPSGNAYDDTSVAAGSTYWYFVKGCSSNGCSGFSASDSGYRALVIPSVPTGINASDGTYTDKVQISWTAASSAAYYEVYRNSSNSTSGVTLLGSPNLSPYDDTSATAGTTFWYFVKACNSAGYSAFSTGDPGNLAVTIPPVPTGISASDGTYTDKVQISWTASSGASYFEVYRNSTNSTSGVTLLGSPGASLYDDTFATAGSTFWYFVKACNSAGCSGFSASDPGSRKLVIPTSPMGLSATDGTYTDKVQISWTGSSDATYYEVYRNSTNSTTGVTLLGSPSASPYADTSATEGSTFWYYVKACNAAGCSSLSASDSGSRAITIPSAPTGVSATDGTFTDKVQVTWTTSSGSSYYQVYRNSSNSSNGATLLGSPGASPYDDTSATAGNTSWYFIKACNSGGCSTFSSGDSGYRAITAPTGVSASDGTYTDKVLVTWTAASGATYYQVYRNSTNSTSGVTLLGSPGASPYNDTSATAGSTYWYFVKGCNPNGCSTFSSSDSGSRAVLVVAPPVPTGVSATDGAFTDKVQISWVASNGAGYYEVYRNSTNSTSGVTLLGSPGASPFDDTSAAAGTNYWYFVKACNSAGCSTFSSSDSGSRAVVVAVPSAPTGVSASDGTYTDKVQVTWTGSNSASYYQVYRNSSNSSNGATLLGSPGASPYNDTSATAGSTYWYFIKACNSAGCSGFSASDSGYRVISAPTGVSASDGTYTDKVQISWTAASGATYYQIYRNSSNSTSGVTLLGSPGTSPYDDTSATAGSISWYFVKACNSGGCSGFSTSDSGSRALVIASAPTRVSASDGTYTDKVQVSWTGSSGATYYQVYRNSTNSTGGVTLLGSPGASPYDDTSVMGGRTYWYFVKACNSAGCSSFSASDSGSKAMAVPSTPTGVSASDGTNTDKVQISWTASSSASYYQVYRNSSNSSNGATLLGSPGGSSYDDTSATAGSTYWYFIKACNSTGCSGFSTSDSGSRGIAVPSAPTGVTASDGTYSDKVQISWTAASGATYYQVYRNSTNSSSGVKLLGSPGTSPYADTTATAGSTFWYFVKACNPGGCSGFSTSDSGSRALVIPSAPTGMSASDGVYTNMVLVSWTGSSGATYYQVYRNSTNSTSGVTLLGSPSVSSYDDTSVRAGIFWYFAKACNSAGCSDFSAGESGYLKVFYKVYLPLVIR